jgi:hypothetical protein
VVPSYSEDELSVIYHIEEEDESYSDFSSLGVEGAKISVHLEFFCGLLSKIFYTIKSVLTRIHFYL